MRIRRPGRPIRPVRMCRACYLCMDVSAVKCPNCGSVLFEDDSPIYNKIPLKRSPVMKEKFWMVVNVTGSSKCLGFSSNRDRLPDDQRPNVMHHDEDAAKRELVRLADQSPDKTFVLLEAVSIAIPKPVVTHIIVALESPVPF